MGLFDIDPQLLQGIDMNRAAQNPGFKKKLMGLLGSGPDDPQSQGLLGLASALLQASGPSTMPTSMGQALGQGLQGYNQNRTTAQRYKDVMKMQQEELGLKRQALQAEMNQKSNPITDFQRDLIAAGINPSSPEGQNILKSRYDKGFMTPLQSLDFQQRVRDMNNPSMNLSKGQEAVDRKFADDYVEFKASGGFADVQKGIEQVGGVLQQLESGQQNLTGPVVGRVGDTMRSVFNPEAQAAKDAVEEVVQRNLRLVLGAQFTEKEGERLISRAYNPALSESENAKRLRRLVGQIQTAAQAKQEAAQYFEENGTLKGFKGKVYSATDFMNMKFDDPKQTGKPQSGGIQFLGFE